MAFLLSALGSLPGQIVGSLLSGHHGSGHAQSPVQTKPQLGFASSFGSVLHGQMDALGANDPLANLTAVVQNGTPISTVVDRLANRVADAVNRHLPASGFAHGASRQQLVGSIKAALSPPSNAPPGRAADQVAALARRTQAWLGGVARGAGQQAGQQSDTSGHILDANSAKDIPAQQDPEATSGTTPGASSLAQSLLASVAASFATGTLSASQLAPTTATGNGSLQSASLSASARQGAAAVSDSAKAIAGRASTLARLQTQIVTQTGKDGPAQIQQDLSATLGSTAATAQAPDASGAPAAPNVPVLPNAPLQSGAQSAGSADPADLLARMLIRAAGVDARVNGPVAATAAAAPLAPTAGDTQTARSPLDGGGTFVPASAAAGRLASLLAHAVGSAARASNDNASNDGSNTGLASQFRDALPAAVKGTARNDAPLFAATAAPATAPSATLPQGTDAASSTPRAPLDPSAVVEQVVKGMAMRNGADGTSEVRLRLSPESLGDVSMKLTVSGNNVTAVAVAQNGEAQRALLAHQHQLARSLADAGLKLTGFTVDLSGGHMQQHDRGSRDQNSGFGRHYTVHEAMGASDPNESFAAGPPLLGHSTMALFNYLA